MLYSYHFILNEYAMRKLTFASSIGAIALFALVGFGQPARATEKLELEPVSKVKVPGTFVTGTLTAMSSASVPATLTVKAGATIYTAEVTSATTIVRRYNGSTDLGEFLVGDTVEVRGTLSNDVANTISATKLKTFRSSVLVGRLRGKLFLGTAMQVTLPSSPKDAMSSRYTSPRTRSSFAG